MATENGVVPEIVTVDAVTEGAPNQSRQADIAQQRLIAKTGSRSALHADRVRRRIVRFRTPMGPPGQQLKVAYSDGLRTAGGDHLAVRMTL